MCIGVQGGAAGLGDAISFGKISEIVQEMSHHERQMCISDGNFDSIFLTTC